MKKNLSQLGPALFFSVVVFISIPFEIIGNNIEDIVGAGSYIWAFFLLGLVFFLLNAFLAKLLKEVQYRWVSRILFAMATFIILTDVLAPLMIDSLETGGETAQEPLQSIIIEIVLFIIIGVVAFLLPKKTLTICWPIGLVILFYQIFLLSYEFFPASFKLANTELADNTDTKFNGNIYQFVFDSYSGGWFPYAMQELQVQQLFKDFTYFSHARSNYISTAMSFPSFTTGELFEGGVNNSLRDWRQNQADNSLLLNLKSLGFHTTTFTISRHTGNQHAHINNIDKPITWTLIADLWLLRLAPTLVRQEAFKDGRGLFSMAAELMPQLPSGDLRSYHSFLQFQKILESEKNRAVIGEFVFAHVYPPHGPYQLTRSGTYTRESSYEDQLFLATSMMAEFIKVLRAQGKYDTSLIIFQSDHGIISRIPEKVRAAQKHILPSLDSIVNKRIREVDVRGWTGEQISNRTHALLLVKLPLIDQEKINFNQKLVQLLDIKHVVKKVIENHETPSPIQSNELSLLLENETVNIYHGFHRKDKKVIGRELPEAYFNHYVVNKNNQWTIDKEILVQY